MSATTSSTADESNCVVIPVIHWEDRPDVSSTHQSSHSNVQTMSWNTFNADAILHVDDSKKEHTIDVEEVLKQAKESAVAAGGASLSLFATGASVVELAVVCALPSAYAAACSLFIVGRYVNMYRKNRIERIKHAKALDFNRKAEEFNMVLAEFDNLQHEMRTIRAKVIEQEEKLNKETFKVERGDKSSKIVVAIGPTGYGKSVFCNRMIGSEQDTLKIAAEKDDAAFKVGVYGCIDSETVKLNKVCKQVHITAGQNFSKFNLSMVDSPGAFDSEGCDDHFENMMVEYFRACTGINMFCVFFKFGAKMDSNYKKLLDSYKTFWGENFWKQCVVIVTYCDMDNKKMKFIMKTQLDNVLHTVKQELGKVCDCSESIPIYPVGEENFQSSIGKLMMLLSDSSQANRFSTKYVCEQIKSPLEVARETIEPMLLKHQELITKLAKLDKELNALQNQIKLLCDELL